LGAGEREAISLALEIRAHLLLIDERAGRQQAEERHIEVTGTLAVLLRAAVLGLVDFPATIMQIKQLGFRVSQEVEGAMLAKYQDIKKQSSTEC
jgi:predicted nucleic acid-binding protein